MTDAGATSEVTSEDLQKIKRLLIDVATHIMKDEKKAALDALREVEVLVLKDLHCPGQSTSSSTMSDKSTGG